MSIDASSWFTNPATQYLGQPMTWGQFIRWVDPATEQAFYHDHTGNWPSVDTQEWLQWTQSPPNIVDIDGDGKNEVLGVPNAEMYEPYVTQAYAIMVLEGAYGSGDESAMRKAGSGNASAWRRTHLGKWLLSAARCACGCDRGHLERCETRGGCVAQ